jgi:uncharacterized protein YkwD
VLQRHLVVALVLVLSIPLFESTPAHAVDDHTAGEIRNRIEYLINRARVRHGLRRLRINDKTRDYAIDHAQRMARRATIFHDGNLGNEVPPGCEAWAENVGRTSASRAARSAMNMFMDSSSHRSNILSRRMTHMGIGVAKRGQYTYIVQRFIDR